MADFTIDAGLNFDATKALAAVRNIGKTMDDAFARPHSVNADTKAAEKEIKNLGAIADKTFKDIGDSAGKNIGGAGLFDGLKKSFAEGQDAANSGGGIFGSLAGGLGQLITPAGAATAAIGAVTAGLTAAFTVGQEYEQGLAGLSAITGLTGDALNDIGDRAKNLAITFGGDVSTQISSFQGILSRFGADLAKTPGDLQKVSENINILAKAGGIDAAAAMDTLTGAMLQFGVNTSNSSELAAESSRFINVMAASARVGAAEIPQVGEAITVAGVAMKKAKVSFEEGNASIQVLAAGGKFGAEAGTALRNVLGKIAGEEVIPKEALAKMKSLGINMKIVADTSLPLEARLKELGKGAKDATAFTQLFGAENSAAATILASGADQVGAWTKEITGTSDATKQAAVNMGTLSEQISRGKAQIEVFAINTFQVLNPIVSEISGTIIQAFGVIADVLKPTFDKLVGTFSNVFNRISSVLKPILAFFGGSFIAQWTIIFASVGEIINSFYTTVVTIFDGIVDAVQPIIVAFKKAFNITDDVTKSFDPLKTFQQILSFITSTISDLGNILTAVGGFIAQALLVPFQLAGAAIAKVIEWVVDLNNWLSELTGTATDTGKTTASLSEYFDTFINIIKQAPDFIRAVTAGFKAFVGGITDLISNFSFDKLKDLLSGKTVVAAFTGSQNEDALKKQGEALLGGFEKSAERLTALGEKVNLSRSEQDKKFNLASQELQKKFNAVDFQQEKELFAAKTEQQKKAIEKKYQLQKEAISKDFKIQKDRIVAETQVQKEEDIKAFNAEKIRIFDQINAKEKAKEIDAKQAEILRAKILDINLAADKKEGAATIAALDADGKEKKTKLKDIQKDILAVEIEARKVRNQTLVEADKTQFSDAQIAQKKALQDLDVALSAEIEKRKEKDREVQNDEKISAVQKAAFAKQTEDLITAVKAKGVADTAIINKKFADAQIKEENKNALELLKTSLDNAKARIESVNSLEANSSEQELQNLIDLNDAKNALITAQEAQKVEIAIRANGKVLEAEEALKAALATQLEAGGAQRVDAARIALAAIENEVSKSDKVVLDIHRNTNRELLIENQKFSIDKRTLAAQNIPDEGERERELRLIEVDKTFTKELEAAKGNERLKNDAYAKAALDRLQIEKDFADKQKGLFGTFADGFKSLTSSLSDSFKTAFEDAAKLTEVSKEEQIKQTKDVEDQLKKREISYEDYTKKIDAITKDSTKSIGRIFADGLKIAFQGVANSFKKTSDSLVAAYVDTGNKILDAKDAIGDATARRDKAQADGNVDEVARASSEIRGLQAELSSDAEKNSKIATQAYNTMTLATAASFGVAIAEGKKNFGEYVIMALDALESLVPIIAAQIFGLYSASPNPVNVFGLGLPGIVEAGIVTVAFTALVEAAKAGIKGFEKGGHTGYGAKSEVKGVVHGDEFVYSKDVTSGQVKEHNEMFQLLKSGVNLGDILGAYKRPEMSNYVITMNGQIQPVHHRNFEQPTVNYGQVANLSSNNNDELVREVKALRAENALMRADFKKDMQHRRNVEHEVTLTGTLKQSGADMEAVLLAQQRKKLQYS